MSVHANPRDIGYIDCKLVKMNLASLSSRDKERRLDSFGILKEISGMRIVHMNAQGLLTGSGHKIEELRVIVTKARIDVICITESCLRDDNYVDNEIAIEGYQANVQHRQEISGHGGVVLYISNTFASNIIYRSTADGIDAIVAKLDFPHSVSVYVGGVYRNPKATVDASCEHLESLLSFLDAEEAILVGDFNFQHRDTRLVQLFRNHLMKQMVKVPTRVTSTSSTIIDHVYANNHLRIVKCDALQHQLADHRTTYAVRKIDGGLRRATHNIVKYRNMKKFDEAKFATLLGTLSYDSGEVLRDPSAAVDKWTTHIQYCINNSAPIAQRRVRSGRPPRWLTPEIVDQMHLRDFLLRKHDIAKRKQLPLAADELHLRYRQQRNAVNAMIRASKKNQYESAFVDDKCDRDFWKVVKPHLPSTSPRHEVNASATMLNEVFVSDVRKVLQVETNEVESEMVDIEFHEDVEYSSVFKLPTPSHRTTKRYIECLKTDKAIGYDNISASILKRGGDAIVSQLTLLICAMFCSGTFADKWKICRIAPIYKTANEYRPISLICIVSKVIEDYVCNHLREYLDDIGFWAKNQFGFRKLHSTTCALLLIQNYIAVALNGRMFATVICIDLRKAFEVVDRDILLRKLRRLGCHRSAMKWFTSYLLSRKQYTKVNDDVSTIIENPYGVPQGSKLGPILFAIFINDLCTLPLHGKVVAYADDMSIIYEDRDASRLEVEMNADMRRVSAWLRKNRLVANVKKSNIMFVRGQKPPRRFSVKLGNEDLPQVTQQRILGVTFTEDFKFSSHLKDVEVSARRRVNVMLRLRHFLPTRVLNIIFTACILPTLTYCSTVWRFAQHEHLDACIKLQKYAARIIMFQPKCARTSPLFAQLNWTPLPDIWRRDSLRIIHKLKLGIASPLLTPLVPQRLCARETRSTARSETNIPRMRNEYLERTIAVNGAREYDGLDISVRHSSYPRFCKFLKDN